MSKTYSDQVEKAKALAAGLRKNFESVRNLGITQEQLDRIEADAEEAMKMNHEVEELREVVRGKAATANIKLNELKEQMKEAKQVVKLNFEQPRWESFGIADKR